MFDKPLGVYIGRVFAVVVLWLLISFLLALFGALLRLDEDMRTWVYLAGAAVIGAAITALSIPPLMRLAREHERVQQRKRRRR